MNLQHMLLLFALPSRQIGQVCESNSNYVMCTQGWDGTLQDDNLEFETSLWSSAVCADILRAAENQIEHFLQLGCRILRKSSASQKTGNSALFSICKKSQDSLRHFVFLAVPLAEVRPLIFLSFPLWSAQVMWKLQIRANEQCVINILP